MKLSSLFFVALASFAAISCEDNLDETPESSFQWNELYPPKYSFTRNDASSVDYQECDFLAYPLNIIYDNYLNPARLSNQSQFDLMLNYYDNGVYGIAPKEEIARSPLVGQYRPTVLKDIDILFDDIRRISGGYASQAPTIRNREAEPGVTGFIGSDITDPNLLFADEKGVVVADVFNMYISGAIYLDKIINLHLDEAIYTSETYRNDHQNVVLPPGRNYTQLEHHWDLAYGYYTNFWKKFAQADGIPIMKHSQRTLFEAFAYGRDAMRTYDYVRMINYLHTIKEELSRVAAIRTMNYLLGPNTMANIAEEPKFAFGFISQAIGLIYALQFASDAQGHLYYEREQLLRLVDNLKQDQGLWNVERLLAGQEVEGSLLHTAAAIGEPFGITTDQIKR